MEPIEPKFVGRRLAAICEALDMRKGHFADSIGIDRSSFTKMVKGEKPLLAREAWQIYRLYGIDLNFTYGGQVRDLPPNLSSKLMQILNTQKR